MLLYDGDCRFCTSVATWARDRLGDAHEVVPYQEVDDLDSLGLTGEQAARAAWWVGHGEPRRAHRAVAATFRAIGGVWYPIGVFIDVPPVRWLGAGVYALVARNRHRLPGAPPCADC